MLIQDDRLLSVGGPNGSRDRGRGPPAAAAKVSGLTGAMQSALVWCCSVILPSSAHLRRQLAPSDRGEG
jgi:hypothetical protein